jgi:hypothetical protein
VVIFAPCNIPATVRTFLCINLHGFKKIGIDYPQKNMENGDIVVEIDYGMCSVLHSSSKRSPYMTDCWIENDTCWSIPLPHEQ